MRIINGTFKGRRLSIPKAFSARPTTDFAKESLFNILCNTVDWQETSVLDLFAGTGSISLECISRGCRQASCVEKNIVHARFIHKMSQELDIHNLSIYTMDAFRFLNNCKETYNFIFADPPYDHPLLEKVPQLILEKNLLSHNGIFVMEHSKKNDFSALPYFAEKRVYGSVNFSFFRKESI